MAAIDPAAVEVKCHTCDKSLWKKRRGEWTLANRIIKVGSDGRVVALCPGGCGADIEVPLLSSAPLKEPAAATPKARRRVIVRRVVDNPPQT